jgi:hypothetical protein
MSKPGNQKLLGDQQVEKGLLRSHLQLILDFDNDVGQWNAFCHICLMTSVACPAETDDVVLVTTAGTRAVQEHAYKSDAGIDQRPLSVIPCGICAMSIYVFTHDHSGVVPIMTKADFPTSTANCVRLLDCRPPLLTR